jgi:hypothetical protein
MELPMVGRVDAVFIGPRILPCPQTMRVQGAEDFKKDWRRVKVNRIGGQTNRSSID